MDTISTIISGRTLLEQNIKKKQFGEIFTPFGLIDKMFELFPVSIWSDPHKIWFEPTCGMGSFMVSVYHKLMNGLSSIYPDESERRRHILKNMLYMLDIQPENVQVCREIFGPDANIYCGDILTFSLVTKFDIIIGNPPFQSSTGSLGKNKLYEKIVMRSLLLLKDSGFLMFIVPDNLFSGNSSIAYDYCIRLHILNLILFGKSDQAKYFPNIHQPMCYFMLVNVDVSSSLEKFKTLIKNQNGDVLSVNMISRPLNPIRNWTNETELLIQKYITHCTNSSVYHRGYSLSRYGTDFTEMTPVPVLYNPHKNIWGDKNVEGFGIRKVIIYGVTPFFSWMVDNDGKYGIGPNMFYIPIPIGNNNDGDDDVVVAIAAEHMEKIDSFFSTLNWKKMVNAVRTTRQFLKIALIRHLNLNIILSTSSTILTPSSITPILY